MNTAEAFVCNEKHQFAVGYNLSTVTPLSTFHINFWIVQDGTMSIPTTNNRGMAVKGWTNGSLRLEVELKHATNSGASSVDAFKDVASSIASCDLCFYQFLCL
ncbi:hypothetical protein V6N13_121938 [Hibiscus sabdariffa]|uniref:Legume lectin domain-containing protein n=1 Tax=Hibiscus sabdariffa TaxID=183260 RepID=A0ABR2NE57_9ROSI